MSICASGTALLPAVVLAITLFFVTFTLQITRDGCSKELAGLIGATAVWIVQLLVFGDYKEQPNATIWIQMVLAPAVSPWMSVRSLMQRILATLITAAATTSVVIQCWISVPTTLSTGLWTVFALLAFALFWAIRYVRPYMATKGLNRRVQALMREAQTRLPKGDEWVGQLTSRMEDLLRNPQAVPAPNPSREIQPDAAMPADVAILWEVFQSISERLAIAQERYQLATGRFLPFLIAMVRRDSLATPTPTHS